MAAEAEPIPGALPRSFLRPILLLLLAEGPSHGYDLMAQTGDLGIDSPDPGGLYRTLRLMEHEGYVQSWWEASSAGPARRTYALTATGLELLHDTAASLRDTVRHLYGYLSRYENLLALRTPEQITVREL
jgi:PadR family transcriptional regulator, regulatory protein PadR